MLTLARKTDCAECKPSIWTRLAKPITVVSSVGTAIMAAGMTASADSTYTPETFQASQLDSIFTALHAQFNVSFVLAVIGAIIAASAALVAMWWGARKGVRMLMSAFKRGKLRI